VRESLWKRRNCLSTGSFEPILVQETRSLKKNEIEDILTKYRTVAVVGISRDPSKDSHSVPAYLKDQGYKIIPVNPSATEILGLKSYKSLLDVPPELQKTIEIVDIFRPADDVPPIVEQAVELKERYDKPYVIWMQLGIINEQAASKARDAGMLVVMNRCMRQEHRKLFPNGE
jgi:predicted CoA-binding protein